jgi:hypothetical protein
MKHHREVLVMVVDAEGQLDTRKRFRYVKCMHGFAMLLEGF